MIQNVSFYDRMLRLLAGGLVAEVGYFWLGTPWNWLAYAIGAVLLLTALAGHCPLYRLAGKAGLKPSPGSSLRLGVAGIFVAAVLAGAAYGSIFFSRKFFLEDYNAMNHFYKQALFLTGQNKREEALKNFEQWKPAFEQFAAKYTRYRPVDLKGDQQLEADFTTVRAIMASAEPLVQSGDLHEAHLALEKVRPVFQEVFKRNGFSMLSVALVEFHDAMETILDAANANDAAKAVSLYPAISDKLKVVEAEANDAEIQDIRKALEALNSAAQAAQVDALPQLSGTLKSSFVKVYLKRG